MQQYYNSYPSQPNYYTQPYDGSGPYNGYTPYAQQPQQNLWPTAPTPYTAANGLPPPMQIQSGTVPPVSNPYRSNHQRRATMPSNNPGKPLKSALKRNGTYAPSTPVPLQRKQALSYQKQNYMGMPMSVDYTNSNKQGYQLDEDEAGRSPYHIVISYLTFLPRDQLVCLYHFMEIMSCIWKTLHPRLWMRSARRFSGCGREGQHWMNWKILNGECVS